jgi:hypothetical protein
MEALRSPCVNIMHIQFSADVHFNINATFAEGKSMQFVIVKLSHTFDLIHNTFISHCFCCVMSAHTWRYNNFFEDEGTIYYYSARRLGRIKVIACGDLDCNLFTRNSSIFGHVTCILCAAGKKSQSMLRQRPTST